MTLNLTVTTPERIYQCADLRLVDPRTGQAVDAESRKLVLVNAFEWSATVCYTGVAQTPSGTFVGDWLTDLAHGISPKDPLDALLDSLLSADTWLAEYPIEARRICFSVGAFAVDRPVFALVSNFAEPSGKERTAVADRLILHRVHPRKPKAYVQGVLSAVSRAERRRLERLAARQPQPAVMYEALAEVNRRVARTVPEWVSEACFTSHLSRTGEGGGRPHGIVASAVGDLSMIPPAFESTVRELIAKEFPQGASISGLSFGRAPASEAHHRTMLKEKPRDPNVHNNFGAFLLDKQDDLEGAERHYLKALEFDRRHTNALGNLANLRWRQGRIDEAEALYRKSLDTDGTNENVVRNFVRFRRAVFGDIESTRSLLDESIQAHPRSGRLRVLRAENTLRSAPAAAVADLEQARDLGADQAVVEPLYAFAVQLAGRSIEECVAAYRTAIAVDDENGALHLNLSQLLFSWGESREAGQQLALALQKGLDPPAELEAILYSLAHLPGDVAPALERVRELCAIGARLDWDVSMTLDAVASVDPVRAAHLRNLVAVMRGEIELEALDGIRDDFHPG